MGDQHTNGRPDDRVRIVYLDERIILDVLNWISEPGNCCLMLPTGCGLPDGTRTLRVWVDYERRAIGALVWHESFDECPPGAMPKVHGGGGLTTESRVLHRRDYPRL